MLLTLRHISRTLLTLLAASLLVELTACTQSDEPDPGTSDRGDMEVSIRISAASVSNARAFSEEYGTIDEMHLNLGDLKILLFDENQVLYDVFYDCGGVVSVRNSETHLEPLGLGTYVLRVKLSGENYSRASKFAIVALANWQGFESTSSALSTNLNGLALDKTAIGTLTISDLKEAIFSLNAKASDAWMPGNGNWIPMFGSLHGSLEAYDIDIFNAANPMPLGTINLVRAFSKIEVINNDLSDFAPQIVGMDLMRRTTSGRLMQDFNFGGATDQVTHATMPAAPGLTSDVIPFHREGNVYTIYVPEMEFTTNPNERRAIRLTLDLQGQTEEKWIYFAPYDSKGLPVLQAEYADNEWNAILRNHIYRYTINSLAFEFLVSVKKWIFGGKVHIQFEQEDDEDVI